VTNAQNLFFRLLMVVAMMAIILSLMQLMGASQTVEPSSHSDTVDTTPIREIILTKEQRLSAMANDWSGEIAYGAPYSALTPLNSVENAATDIRFNPADDYWGLPHSEGVETVAGYCSACHSLAIVMQQRQTDEGWDYLLNWMVEKQGMSPPPDDMRIEIISYLAREFGQE